jgi:hypothetical protein
MIKLTFAVMAIASMLSTNPVVECGGVAYHHYSDQDSYDYVVAISITDTITYEFWNPSDALDFMAGACNRPAMPLEPVALPAIDWFEGDQILDGEHYRIKDLVWSITGTTLWYQYDGEPAVKHTFDDRDQLLALLFDDMVALD